MNYELKTENLTDLFLDLNTEDLTQWSYRPFLFYGPSGCGKTYLSAQFPDVLILSCDPGPKGGLASARQFNPKAIKVKDYNNLLSIRDIIKPYARVSFKTLVIDSLTYAGKMCLDNILKSSFKEVPKFDEFNLNASRMRNLIESFSEFPCQIIFNCTSEFSKNELSGQIFEGPSLIGKLSSELPQVCDVVLKLSTSLSLDKGKQIAKYTFKSCGDDSFFAKDCLGLLPLSGETSFDYFKPLYSKKA